MSFQNTAKIQVSLVPPLSSGTTSGMITLYLDDKPHVIPVRAIVESDFIITPKAIVLTTPKNKTNPSTLTRYVAVRSRDKKSFNIQNITPPEPSVKVDATPLGSAGYRITLTNLKPINTLDGKTLTIKTDHQSNSILEIPIRIVK